MLLLDTHALLWDAFDPARLPRRVRTAIDAAAERREIHCCDISIWEIAMLAERGRIVLPPPFDGTLRDLIARRWAVVLPITPSTAVRANGLYALRGDPADSLIAATAIEHSATLVSADERIHALAGVKVLW